MSDFANALAAEGVTTDSINTAAGLTQLTGNDSLKNQGSFVLTGQPLATDKGFRNVSHIWYDKTMDYSAGLAKLAADKAQTHDIQATVAEMVPTVNDKGEFVFLHRPTEGYFKPTKHAMGQVGNWADTGTWFVQNMLENPEDYKGREKYARDRGDAETLARVIANGFRRLDQKKKFFWRTREDGTMRAMLTDRYAVVDNRWFIELLAKLIPGGRLSHWRGDGDTLYSNVLIPDTIREEKDSEYGAMLSIGNSEIGERRVSSLPSIFRAICMNGCIWGQEKGKGIRQVHRGAIKLDALALEIKENLNVQIPLALTGIDRFLGTRSYAWDGCEAKPVIAQIAKQFKLGKGHANGVLDAYGTEAKLTPDLGHTLFTVINAVTRAGQKYEAKDWVAFDEIGGEMAQWDGDEFGKVIKRAKSLGVKDVEEMFVKV